MGRAVSSAQLQIRVDRAKKREAAQLAKKLSTDPKPYQGKPETILVKAQQISNNKIYVSIPVAVKNWNEIPAATKAALGVSLASVAPTGAGASLVEFEGNHKDVLRVEVNEGLSTPTSKTTDWGTRVVKSISKSFSFPVGNDDLGALITAFRTQFGEGGAARDKLLGTKNGFATLKLGKQDILTIK